MSEKTTTAQAAAPEAEKPQRKITTKKALLWATGVTPTVMMAREVKSTASVVGWALRNIVQTFWMNREQAKEDLARAKASPEAFWDEVVKEAKVTEQSLRKRYSQATFGAYACLVAISVSSGILAAYQGAAAATIGNIALINILLIIYINHLHKLYTAREQRIITSLAFMKEMLRSPALMLPQPLPPHYKLRTAPTSAKAAGD